MKPQPLVSIITPCLNSGRFLERTIQSVLAQDYPRIEYIVMDGGSTDGGLEILKRYRGQLEYYSEPDRGAADAINKAFGRSRGEIVAWINADDEYVAGAVTAVVRWLADHPDVAVVYGLGTWVDEHGAEIGPYPTCSPYDREMLKRECGICQPAAFMRKTALDAVGGLDAGLQFAFDYELWIRLARAHQFAAIPERIALSRMHGENKTISGRRRVFQESIKVLRRHYGYVPVNWVYGYVSFLRDGRDQYFEPLRHSPAMYTAALVIGSVYNCRVVGRYWKEWRSRLRMENLARIRKKGAASPNSGK